MTQGQTPGKLCFLFILKPWTPVAELNTKEHEKGGEEKKRLFLTFQTAPPLASGAFSPLLEQASSSFCAVLDFNLHPKLKTAQTVNSHRGCRLEKAVPSGKATLPVYSQPAAWMWLHGEGWKLAWSISGADFGHVGSGPSFRAALCLFHLCFQSLASSHRPGNCLHLVCCVCCGPGAWWWAAV